ncbi:Pentatricopeptide repeat [Dillenia turbinata]|uniref:Pentatricopeptide repeat n=1 Tax=Dillenia turbinata TaxID=194707 RepID=A0AAN8VJP6_9MAGN
MFGYRRTNAMHTRLLNSNPPARFIQTRGGVLRTEIYGLRTTSMTWQTADVPVLVDLLRDSAKKGSIREAKAIHGFVLKSDFENEELLILLNHIVFAYSKCSDFRAAYGVFDKMAQRNVFSWTIMITGSTENGFYLDGIMLFIKMRHHEILLDKFVYSAIIQSCIGLDCLELGKMLHAQIVILGYASDTFVSTSILNMYAKLGMIKDSCLVFDSLEKRNIVSWNAIISGFVSSGLYLEAYNSFLAMTKEGYMPNVNTILVVLKAVGRLGEAGKAEEVQKYVSDLDLESNVSVGAALIGMYSKCGLLCTAIPIFCETFSKCSANVPWNAMLSGYSQHGRSDEALELYVLMCEKNIESDLYTFCSICDAIAELRCLQFLRQIHGMVFKYGYGSAVMDLNNAIADAYSKCSSLEDVRKIFDRMKERDLVSWTTLVTAYSQCGEGEEALFTFNQMRLEGFTPNWFTFSSVLVACANLCLIEYGHQVHGLLCRAGMAFDKHVESALIDMYSKCGSIDEADKVFKKIVNPDTGSVKDGLDVRNVMKKQGVRKEPGCSWISVKGRVHKFYAGDGMYQLKGEIHSKLDELGKKFEAMGYQPDLRCAFQIEE